MVIGTRTKYQKHSEELDLQNQMSTYLPLETVLGTRTADLQLPTVLDAITFEYRGVTVASYGTLHGLTGGTNREYVNVVNKTISLAKGIRFYERDFQRFYKGLDVDMQDWAAIPIKDAARLAASSMFPPQRLVALVAGLVREKRAKADNFGSQGIGRLQDIGGSTAYHLLEPLARRAVAGFPQPPLYLVENLRRRDGEQQIDAPVFPDARWDWMGHAEPFANLPLRSIHMVEFATEFANLKGEKNAALFVGEIHNTDMAWYANGFELASLTDAHQAVVTGTINRARVMAQELHNTNRVRGQAAFQAAALCGAMVPMFAYVAVLLWLAASFV